MTSHSDQQRPRDWGFYLLILGLFIAAVTIQPSISGDGAIRFQVLDALMNGETLPPSKYSIIQPLISYPLAWTVDQLGFSYRGVIRYFNIFVMLGLGQYIFRKIALAQGRRFATDMALLVLGASMIGPSLASYYGEVLTAFTIVAGFLSLRSQPWLGSALLAIGVTNTPVIGIAVLLAAIALRQSFWPIVAALAAAFVFFLGETYLKFGGLLGSGYFSQVEHGPAHPILPYSGRPGFSYPMFLGVVSIFFSFGKGLIFFFPSLALFLSRRRMRRAGLMGKEGLALGLFALGLILVYSKWWAWHGAGFWGPRFFLIFIFPVAFLVADQFRHAMERFDTMVLALVLVASTWVAMASLAFGEFRIIAACESQGALTEVFCYFVPEFSPLWRAFIVHEPSYIVGKLAGNGLVIWQVLVCGYFILRVKDSVVQSTQYK